MKTTECGPFSQPADGACDQGSRAGVTICPGSTTLRIAGIARFSHAGRALRGRLLLGFDG
jgi:hypothetical protein